MVHTLRAVAATLALGSTLVHASTLITCDDNNHCPSSAPCCSSYGYCGVGAYCLGGCFPRDSYSLDSCMPAPVCSSADYKLTSLDGVIANTEYLGDASSANWVSSGTPVVYQDEGILLTMAPETVGTLLTSTHYVWYGKIGVTMTTSQGAGVVTAFIMMSDVKDEIDMEFVGVDLQHVQSNYYWQGTLDYDNEVNLTAASTESTLHTYTIDWMPDYITWAVDGTVLRTLYRNETYNDTTHQYQFPQTPSRIELSLWPAGLSTNSQGTIDWAGGQIDWDSPYMSNGYYYAMIQEVTVECYSPPAGYNDQGDKSYYYDSTVGTNNTVVIGNNNTILSSFYATGENPTYDPNASTATSSGASASATDVETVPGDSGAGSRGDDSAAAQASVTDPSSGSTTTSSSSGGFVQGSPSDGTNDGARVVAGSVVGLIAFLAAAMLL